MVQREGLTDSDTQTGQQRMTETLDGVAGCIRCS